MTEKFKIGIVGQGFVGTAVRQGLQKFYNIHTFDKYKEDVSTCKSLEELSQKSNIIFVCLPTPMRKNGSCDLSFVAPTLKYLNDKNTFPQIIVIKSTIPPGTTTRLNK